ncbi:glutathione S-transferase theta-2B isoform X2 [Nycticebus coucang]|uniref:glutathione S-transferase theta-2B isoform X2 n=1 Tax=Nycticebus coucang TaxID=9470 RepID=UPI00234C6291|nr:glutathione S-transferase theta-2B isoform X2 [Nycticebus coucang]
MELYLHKLSQPSRAVYIFAKKNGIPFKMHDLEMAKGLHLSEFMRVNKLKSVPTLKDADFVLTESSAILIYLSCKYQTADHWYPRDLQARARVHEYLGWHADHIRGTFGVPLWTRVLAPLIGIQVPEEKVERNRTAMDRALKRLEDKFLGDRAFLAGQQPVAVGHDLFEGRQRLAAWRGQVEAFLGAELCQEAHGPIFSVLEQVAKKTFPVPPPEAYPNMLSRIARIP